MDPATRGRSGRSAVAQPAHFHQKRAARLNEYKVGLLEEFSNESEAFRHFARLAVNEAESLAWSTPYAHLFLPSLVEEEIHYARQWASRQCRVGNGLPAVATSHKVIEWNERVGIQPDTLATGRVPRSSEAASHALEAARGDTRPQLPIRPCDPEFFGATGQPQLDGVRNRPFPDFPPRAPITFTATRRVGSWTK